MENINHADSDALLMSMHKDKVKQQKYLYDTGQKGNASPHRERQVTNYTPQGGASVNVTSRIHQSSQFNTSASSVMDKSVKQNQDHNGRLSQELSYNYGGKAENVAFSPYGQHNDSVKHPRLISEILSERNREHSRKQGEKAEDLKALNNLRQNLIEQEEKFNRQKIVHQRRKEYLKKNLSGEYGVSHLWQLENYHLAAGTADKTTDKFLHKYFTSNPDAPSGTVAEKNRVMKVKATQLVMEELLLEVTGELSRSIAREIKSVYGYVKNKTDMHFMQQAEAIAINSPSGRSDDDSAKHLITKGFQHRQKERNKNRKDIWAHTQHQHVAKKTDVDPITKDEDDDVIYLKFHEITPLNNREYTAKPYKETYDETADKLNFIKYNRQLLEYWTKFTGSVSRISVAPRCLGVMCACLSWDHRFLALGTQHGDLLIYDLVQSPPRAVKVLCNVLKSHDPVDHISFSYDGRKILTTNVTGGTVRAWSWQPPNKQNAVVNKEDVKAMGLTGVRGNNDVLPEVMTNVLDLDVDRQDTKFQSGPFEELQLHKSVYGPSLAVFFPTFTLLGTQSNICIALDNGDILRCDIENNYQENMIVEQNGITVSKELPKVYKPKISPQDGPSTIGQGVPSELFRAHTHSIIHLSFIENTRNMVSVDREGFINVWRYHKRHMSGYGYFEPQSKYKLVMSEKMYEVAPNSKREIIFTQKQTPGQPKKTVGEVVVERREAEKKLRDLELADVWHKSFVPKEGKLSYIFPPKGEIPASGTPFHNVVRRASDSLLTAYATLVYKPHYLQATRLIGCKSTCDGKQLIFVLLFPEYPPKSAHLTIVIVDLISMTLSDWKKDVTLPGNDLYKRLRARDLVSFDVSKVYGPTGSAYIFLNVAGELHGYSLVTGQKVLRSVTQSNVKQPFQGCSIQDANLQIQPNAKVMCGGYENKLYLYIYSTAKKEGDKLAPPSPLFIIVLNDLNPPRDRFTMWGSFRKWSAHPTIPPLTLRVDPDPMILSTKPLQHPTVVMMEIIMELIDQVIQSKSGLYDEKKLSGNRGLDVVRNYEDLIDEVEDRRTPFDPEDLQYEDDEQNI